MEISQQLSYVLQRLQDGEHVPMEQIIATPEIQNAYVKQALTKQALIKQLVKTQPNFDENKTKYVDTSMLPDRQGQCDNLVDELNTSIRSARFENGKRIDYQGNISREGKIDIIVGLPASGKSTLADKVSAMRHARLIDNDEAKKLIPEFDNGYGAGLVHTESQSISNAQLSQALARHENLVIPKVGGTIDSITKIIAQAKYMGYTDINVHYVELDRNKTLGRMLSRMLKTGRFLEPALIDKYDDGIHNHCKETFEVLKNHPDVKGYSYWDNDVEFGKDPVLKECKNLDSLNLPDKDFMDFDKDEALTEAFNGNWLSSPVYELIDKFEPYVGYIEDNQLDFQYSDSDDCLVFSTEENGQQYSWVINGYTEQIQTISQGNVLYPSQMPERITHINQDLRDIMLGREIDYDLTISPPQNTRDDNLSI